MKEKINKEVSDALHMLLHCSLKDTEYDTQINQFNIVYKYINKLEQENKQLKEELENIKDFNNKLQSSKDRLDKDDYNLAHILTELEEWLKSHLDDEYYWSKIYWYLENLKEKYK